MRGESWYRHLHDGRLEVKLVAEVEDAPLKMRVSGPPSLVWSWVETFEQVTGQAVTGFHERPPRRGPAPLKGQLELVHAQD